MATSALSAPPFGTGRPEAEPSRSGLSSAEAQRRLIEFGLNEIRRDKATSALALFARQFASPVIWLLVGASVLSAALGELLDAGAIGVIVIVNAVIGFLQEHRAERAVMALRSMTAPRARVVRDGHSVMIPAAAIVPGDLLVLEAGDVAAADARLHTAHALTTNEAPLTGESTPVEKTTAPTTPETPLAERHDFVFMGTSVATGTGLAEVGATGMQTELGRIAHLLSTAEDSVTPLQRRLARVSQTLLYICGGIVVVVALAGLLRGWPLLQVFMAAVSLAVAAVPEGLPAVVTIALAVGVQRMAARDIPSHQGPDAQSVDPDLDVDTMAVEVPQTLAHLHYWSIQMTRAASKDDVLNAFRTSSRIALINTSDGLVALNTVKDLMADRGRPHQNLYEVALWADMLRVQGDELFYAYMVDNQAIVIPETIDAIRALAGTVRAANDSIVRTNTALGIDSALM